MCIWQTLLQKTNSNKYVCSKTHFRHQYTSWFVKWKEKPQPMHTRFHISWVNWTSATKKSLFAARGLCVFAVLIQPCLLCPHCQHVQSSTALSKRWCRRWRRLVIALETWRGAAANCLEDLWVGRNFPIVTCLQRKWTRMDEKILYNHFDV